MCRLAGIATLFLTLVSITMAALAEERILSFDSRIEVGKDGVLTVTETIAVRAEGESIRHGIYRDIPVTRASQAAAGR